MGLTLVLEAHNIIIHSLCKYIKYNHINMYKFRPSFLWHMSMLYTFNCTQNRMAEKLYNIKFIVVNMTNIVVNDNQLDVSYIVTGCKWHDF
jgi:phage antirepressor YoqD-like protein